MKRIILIGNKSFIQQNLFTYFKSKNMKALKVKFDKISQFKFFNHDIVIRKFKIITNQYIWKKQSSFRN